MPTSVLVTGDRSGIGPVTASAAQRSRPPAPSSARYAGAEAISHRGADTPVPVAVSDDVRALSSGLRIPPATIPFVG